MKDDWMVSAFWHIEKKNEIENKTLKIFVDFLKKINLNIFDAFDLSFNFDVTF